jgi:hypothetical protein
VVTCAGGKIVVYTGLLDLLGRDPDLVAMVMGHEIAHALARHNTEKMGVGLAASLVLHMVATALGAGGDTKQQHAERQRQVAAARQQRGYHRAYSRPVGADLAPGGDGDQHNPSSSIAAAAKGGGSRAGAMGYQHYPNVPYQHYPSIPNPELEAPPPDPLPGWMTEQLLATFSRLLLELPFSRRAETEADLIGLKLMGLAGYNTAKGPEAFQRLAGEAACLGGRGSRRRGGGGGAAGTTTYKGVYLITMHCAYRPHRPPVVRPSGTGHTDAANTLKNMPCIPGWCWCASQERGSWTFAV